jgi:protein TonB
MPRLDTPPSRRADAPAPPPRRTEPPRRVEPPRRFERSYERADLREPAKEGGGAMRAFILIAVLGSAALAGGLYFGGGMPNFASPPAQEDVASASTPPPVIDDSGQPAGPEELVGVPISDDAAPVQPRRTEIAARNTDSERPAVAQREERDPPPPAPTTSWNGNNGQGGPVSLRPGETTPPSGAATTAPVNPPPVQIASTQPASTPVTARAQPPAPRASVVWSQRPSARRIGELYPDRALREGVGGRVELNCNVRANRSLACNVSNESPAGLGFGQAALSAAQSYRASPALSDGSDSNGADARIVVQFQAPAQ